MQTPPDYRNTRTRPILAVNEDATGRVGHRLHPEESKLVKAVIENTFTDCMEQLQEGYVASVAATAGCSMNPISRDTYGMDVLLVRLGSNGGEEVSIYLQLKNTTTIKPDPSKQHFSYQFKKRRYLEQLVLPRTTIKAFLVVMATKPDQRMWTTATHDQLLVSHATSGAAGGSSRR